MKTLKKKVSGLILVEDFNSPTFSPLLRPQAVYSFGGSYITISSGELLFDLIDHDNLVIDVENDYIPLEYGDYGGIRLKRGRERIDFVEYYTEPQSAYPWVRVVKKNNVYTGFGANAEGEWVNRGQINFHNADTLAIVVNGTAPYVLKNFKAYTSEYVYIYGVLDGWDLYINDVYVTTSDRNELKFTWSTYPFSGNIKIYDGDTLIAEKNLTDAWGGDEYECVVDIDILNDYGEVLPLAGEDFLGNLENGFILRDYYLRNNSLETQTVTLKVAEYSPFYDWIFVSLDPVNVNNYDGVEKEFTVELSSQEQVPFQLFIRRPSDAIEYDYKNKTCSFFLEVV